MDTSEEQLAHQTRLAQWTLRTIGQALLASALVGGVLAVIGVLAEAGWLIALAPAAAFVTFGFVLTGSDAPKAPAQKSATRD